MMPFDTPQKDDFKPMPLNNFGRENRAKQTNFLTFNKQLPSYMAVEYAKASAMPGGGQDWAAELDDTFAKPGVTKFRYSGIANPFAAGIDYNKDMGGPDIFKIGAGSGELGPREQHEYMKGRGKSGGSLMNLPVEKTRKENADVAEYVKRTVGGDKRYDHVRPASYNTNNAYETYGYKEMGIDGADKADENFGSELVMFMRKNKERSKKEKETAIYRRDAEYCPEGHTWVDGHCVPTKPSGNRAHLCPYGWRLNSEGRCQVLKREEGMKAK